MSVISDTVAVRNDTKFILHSVTQMSSLNDSVLGSESPILPSSVAGSDDEMGEISVSQNAMSMAAPETIKAMKDFDGLGNIALLPLFASDFICPDAVIDGS